VKGGSPFSKRSVGRQYIRERQGEEKPGVQPSVGGESLKRSKVGDG